MTEKSKTQMAVEYYLANKDKGVTVYAAAKWVGIDTAAIYRRLKVIESAANQRCPCCGQLIPTKEET